MRGGHHPIVGPSGDRECGTMVEHELRKINVGLAVVEARINVGIGHGYEVRSFEDAPSLHNKLHGKLQGRAGVSGENVLVGVGEVHVPTLQREPH